MPLLHNTRHVKILYAVGSEDNDPDGNAVDNSCPAVLQGEDRLERGMIYFNYLKHFYGPEIEELQSFVSVPEVGHSHNPLFRSKEVRDWIFNRPGVTTSTDNLSIGTFSLKAYPNPMKSSSELSYFLPSHEHVSLKIADLNGRIIRELVNTVQTQGPHTARWETDSQPNGLYILQLQVKDKLKTIPIIVTQ